MNKHIATWSLPAVIAALLILSPCCWIMADDLEVIELRGQGENDLRDRGEDQPASREDTPPRSPRLRQIFAAVDALRELGRPEEARRLLELGQDLQAESRRIEREQNEQREREEVERRERDQIERREREELERRGREAARQERPEEERRARERLRAEQAREDERTLREDRRRDREPMAWAEPEFRAPHEQLPVMHLALGALAEAGREEAAQHIERAIRALQLAAEGRRDVDAVRVYESAPNREHQVELLMLAARILRERQRGDEAQVVGRLAERLAGRQGEQPVPRERDAAMRELERMHLALQALREGERHDAAELLERAIRAREVTLEGRLDGEAQEIREQAPPQEQVVEFLKLASDLWRKFRNPAAAETIANLARELQRREDRPSERGEARIAELRQVQARIRELTAALEELRNHVERLQR